VSLLCVLVVPTFSHALPPAAHHILLTIDWDYVRDWLGIVRWLHVIAAIMWVGITAYFVLVDNSLRPPDKEGKEDGVEGERYWLHGGGFYFMRRYSWGPRELPRDVAWHPQWYAYTTWLSGLGLLIVVYYWKAETYLVDPTVADISGGAAVAISLAVLAVGWLVYDVLCRLLVGHGRILGAVLVLVVVGVAAGLSQLLSARGMGIQVGALLGTWMAGNVVSVFSPAHRRQYAAKEVQGTVNPAWVARSAQRGAHNTFMALPVLFAMLSSHFSFVYASGHAWEALIIIMLVGASVRYFFVQRQKGRKVWAIPVGSTLVLFALAIWLAPETPSSTTGTPSPQAAGKKKSGAAKAGGTSTTVASGKKVFATAGCVSCHTLADAGSKGTLGPNLDQAEPDRDLVTNYVINGQGVMPSFKGKLSDPQIAAVANYVSSVAGR
jgi:uncharacterized membrane protein